MMGGFKLELEWVENTGYVGRYQGKEYVINDYNQLGFQTINDTIFYIDYNNIMVSHSLIFKLIPFVNSYGKSFDVKYTESKVYVQEC